MKIKNKLIIALLGMLIIVQTSCLNVERLTMIRVSEPTNVTALTAEVPLKVVDVSENNPPDFGLAYGTNNEPTAKDGKLSLGKPVRNDYTALLQSLKPNTTYYIRAYYSENGDIHYGEEILEFNTEDYTIFAELSEVSSITQNSAVLNAKVNVYGVETTLSFEWGESESYGNTAEATPGPTNANGIINVSAELSSLTDETQYHYRLKATNQYQTAYSESSSFYTQDLSPPVVTVVSPASIGHNDAVLSGTVNANGYETTVSFEYGSTTSYGNTITAAQSPVSGTSATEVNKIISNLNPGTSYHYRIKAASSQGIAYSNNMTFTTQSISTPTVSTSSVTNIQETTATAGGNVTSDGGVTIAQRGVVFSTSQNPTTSDNTVTASGTTGSFTCNLTDLTLNTTYYVRAYATNSEGTSYGSQESFTTLEEGAGSTVTDIDGNLYTTVIIGEQEWMAENLRVTRYPDGTAIPHITDDTEWANLGNNNTDDAYCWFNNDQAANGETYGALYTYAAAIGKNWTHQNTAGQGVCPDGWHLATDAEWQQMGDYLIANGYNWDGTTTGDKIGKSLAATSGWNSSSTAGEVGNDQSSNNSSGFSALPAGSRYFTMEGFINIGHSTYWWSATEDSATKAWYRALNSSSPILKRNFDYKGWGFSVRCVRD